MAAGVTIDADWLRRPETQVVFSALEGAGFDARVVGGAVRNALLGKDVADIDIATPALPQQVIAASKDAGLTVVPTGLKHGTVTVIVDGRAHEVTTLRHDIETDGRHAVVAFSNDWAQDAARRDFTINALYCDRNGRVFDPLGGLADLERRRVRFIGDPHDRIREDYLRILRFFRFSAEYAEGPFDPNGLAAAGQLRAGLMGLSAERIRAELLKLLEAPRAADAVATMVDHGFLSPLLGVAIYPGLFNAAIDVEAAVGDPPCAIVRLGLLAVTVSEHANWLAKRLRLSGLEREDLLQISSEFPEDVIGDAVWARAEIYRAGVRAFRLRQLSAAARCAGRRRGEILALLASVADWEPPTLPVSGRDLIGLGIEAGPQMGEALRFLETQWIKSDFTDGRRELLEHLSSHLTG